MATHFLKHFLENLISEGTTSLWVEYNDGCAQGCGIHSLLFVIILFSHVIFLLRSSSYLACSKSLFYCPILFQQFLVLTFKVLRLGRVRIYLSVVELLNWLKKLNRALPFENIDSEALSDWCEWRHNFSEKTSYGIRYTTWTDIVKDSG